MSYRPCPAVSRLFDARDIEFLRSSPGYSAGAETAFRRRRCEIFRGYLRTVHAELEETLAGFDHLDGRREFLRLRFAIALVPACFRLLRYRWGTGGVPLLHLIERFDHLLADARHGIPLVQ